MKKSVLKDFVKKDKIEENAVSEIKKIHYSKIKEADKNRELRDIEELAEDILALGYLEQNLVIRKIKNPDFEFELVAGHRRLAAIKKLVNEGNTKFEYLPCLIVEYEDEDLDARERVVVNNLENDPYTASEMMEVIEELENIYKEKKKKGIKMPGRIQNLIAKRIGLGKSQVGNYQKIIHDGIEIVKEKLESGELTLKEAYEISRMEPEMQEQLFQEYDEIDLDSIKEFNDENVPPSGTNLEPVEEKEFDDSDELIEINLDYDEEDDEPIVPDDDDSMIDEEEVPVTASNPTNSLEVNEEPEIISPVACVIDQVYEVEKNMKGLLERYDNPMWEEERQLLKSSFEQFMQFKDMMFGGEKDYELPEED